MVLSFYVVKVLQFYVFARALSCFLCAISLPSY